MPPIVPVFSTEAPSRVGAARWRLGCAVAASAVAHAAILSVLSRDAPVWHGEIGIPRPLSVTLAEPAEPTGASAPRPRSGLPGRIAADFPPEPAPEAQAGPVVTARSGDPAGGPGETRRAEPAPIVAEPTYYAVHELDILPRLSGPVSHGDAVPLGAPGHRVHLELLIDADGTVRKVSALDANAPEASAALAREVWMAARFDPARKAGQAVASRIQLEVSYEPAGGTR